MRQTPDVADLLSTRQTSPSTEEAAWEPIGCRIVFGPMHVFQLQAVLPGRASSPPAPCSANCVRPRTPTRPSPPARAQAADRTVDAISAGRLIGRTEAVVSRETRQRLIDEGHELADFAIVGSGPNRASPHHDAGEREYRRRRARRSRHRRHARRLPHATRPGRSGSPASRNRPGHPVHARLRTGPSGTVRKATAAVLPGAPARASTPWRGVIAAGRLRRVLHPP